MRKIDVMWQYVIYSYLAFWAIILVLGGLASMVLDASPAVMTGITILGSWSPTIVLLLMLRKLKPGMTFRDFYKSVFKEKLKISFLIVILLIVFGVFLIGIWLHSLINNTSISSNLAIPSALSGVMLLTVFQGPGGEESGWRGYLRPELEGRYGFNKGNFILGLVWAFWHAPLWFVASDYTGSQTGIYILANIVVLTALTFIMGIFMKRNNNLLVAFWIHYCFNLSLRFFAGDVYYFAIISVLYILVVVVLLRFLPKEGSKTQ